MVVPRGVRRHRHYSAQAIAWAVALYGVAGLGAARVRRKVSTWQIAGPGGRRGWATLRRWLRALGAGALFPALGPLTGGRREIAERAAQVLSTAAPESLRQWPLCDQAFYGGMQMA